MSHRGQDKVAWGVGGIVLTAAVLAASVVGCQQIAGLFAVFEPPKKIDPMFKPPKDKTILVLVEDRHCPVNYEGIKADLTDKLNQQLKEHKVAGSVISFERLQELIASLPNYQELAVGTIGRKLDADMVLYVNIEDFALKDYGMDSWHGRLKTSVFLLDVHKGRLWPKDKAYPVKMVSLQPDDSIGYDQGSKVAEELAERMADSIAKLFYEYYLSPEDQAKETPERPEL